MKRCSATVLGLLLCSGTAMATPLGVNLLQNPDAESGVTGWVTTGEMTTVSYSTGGGFPTMSDPGPSSRGTSFFAGGSGANAGISTGTQTFNISDLAASVDAGLVDFDLSAYLGGYESDSDRASFEITFKNGGGSVLGTESIGPVTVVDRGYATGLFHRQLIGDVLVGTRTVEARLILDRLSAGPYNDGYADALSLKLTAVPEPGMALLGGAVVLVSAMRRRRRA